MKDDRIRILSKAPVRQAILKMSLPVVLGMMVQVVYNLVDTYFIGLLGDANQLAAVNITTPIFMILMAIAGIIGTGAASYISRCLGENDTAQASRTLSTGIAICVALGALVTVAGLVFLGPFVHALGASEAFFSYAYDYAFVLLIGSIPIMCSFALGQLLRSEGAAMPSITGMLLGTVANVILDPIFIFVFGMGVKGAAIATVLANGLALCYYIYYYASGKTLVKVKLAFITFQKKIWGQIFGIGTPATVSQFLMSISMIICNNLAVGYGDHVVAGMGIASKIMTIGTYVFMGFAGGCQPLVGFNYGAKNFTRIKAVIINAMVMTEGVGIILLAVFAIFAQALISTFTSLPQVITIGTTILRTLMWSQLVLGPLMLANTTVQALGKAKASLLLSIARQGLIYIPLLLLLNAQWQFSGLIYAQPLSDTVALLFSSVVMLTILKKSEKELNTAPVQA